MPGVRPKRGWDTVFWSFRLGLLSRESYASPAFKTTNLPQSRRLGLTQICLDQRHAETEHRFLSGGGAVGHQTHRNTDQEGPVSGRGVPRRGVLRRGVPPPARRRKPTCARQPEGARSVVPVGCPAHTRHSPRIPRTAEYSGGGAALDATAPCETVWQRETPRVESHLFENQFGAR